MSTKNNYIIKIFKKTFKIKPIILLFNMKLMLKSGFYGFIKK
jgi:hypothetical protein